MMKSFVANENEVDVTSFEILCERNKVPISTKWWFSIFLNNHNRSDPPFILQKQNVWTYYKNDWIRLLLQTVIKVQLD